MADRARFLAPTPQTVACGNGAPGAAVQIAPGGIAVVACWLRGAECFQSAGALGTVIVRFYRDAAATRLCSRVQATIAQSTSAAGFESNPWARTIAGNEAPDTMGARLKKIAQNAALIPGQM